MVHCNFEKQQPPIPDRITSGGNLILQDAERQNDKTNFY